MCKHIWKAHFGVLGYQVNRLWTLENYTKGTWCMRLSSNHIISVKLYTILSSDCNNQGTRALKRWRRGPLLSNEPAMCKFRKLYLYPWTCWSMMGRLDCCYSISVSFYIKVHLYRISNLLWLLLLNSTFYHWSINLCAIRILIASSSLWNICA